MSDDMRDSIEAVWRGGKSEEDLLKLVKLDVGFVKKGATLCDNREGRQKQYLYHPEQITRTLVAELEGLSEDEHMRRLLDAGVLSTV